MKSLIVFGSRHGCAEKCAQMLEKKLPGGAELFDLKQKSDAAVDSFDTIVIGGSIYAGKIMKSVQKFCRDRLQLLLQKKIGLYICCMEEGEKAKKEFEDAFPEVLRNHASAKGIFGGEFNFERMNFVERAITKKVAKIDKSVSRIDEGAINRFVTDLKR